MTPNPIFANQPPRIDLSESRTASNNVIGIVMFALATLAMVLRVISKLRYQQKKLDFDEYLMFAGWASGKYGLGRHLWALTPMEMEKITIITFAYVYIYAWSVTVIKLSIIFYYYRIFGMTWASWFAVFLTCAYWLINHIVLPLYCKPLHYYWTQWSDINGGHCPVNEANFYLGIGIMNMIGDIVILIIPIPVVWELQMRRPQKIGLVLIFLLGSFVCIASIIRLTTIAHLTKTLDISWAKSDVFIWSAVEPSVGIISGCLPTLRVMFMQVLHRLGYKSGHGESNGQPSGGLSIRHSRRAYADGTDASNCVRTNIGGIKVQRDVWIGIDNSKPEDELELTTSYFGMKPEPADSVKTDDTTDNDPFRRGESS
ncbi:integral membrane protein Pth11-like [Fusarium austroafricanum]|uniref:Integral membrane protein Pth11-like n=1 Tax=Fusarium austroafricanum TaxID=2364996 RepID=A0A8H4P0Y3_9HYPO|nr:integral membrane protein Pth11-like [Fusarium austroafricanum]